ncbi:peptidoglycan recognition protein 3 [Acomys russatus]|uniref:peptidoglycan recognition protein 3 n=1 Tax=Acomys russatus TaxID=60746 RepID=UPI0021E2A68F|nr:peptidoglycan recognition protein 3 [Acomys russatus]
MKDCITEKQYCVPAGDVRNGANTVPEDVKQHHVAQVCCRRKKEKRKDDLLDDMVEDLDVNEDGTLSFEEFTVLMARNLVSDEKRRGRHPRDSVSVSWDHLKMLPWLLVFSALGLLARGDPSIVSRKEWGASSLTCKVLLSLPVPYLITEQLTRMECQDQITCSQMVRVLQSHSVYNKGWCDLAFNFLVGDDGRVYEGVGWRVQGSHAQGYRNVSLGIAFFGSKRGGSPSPEALSAAKDLISLATQHGYLSPRYIQPFLLKEETCLVPHHSEIPKKACPDIVPRSAWEARETHCSQMSLPAKFVIIIHTAGESCNQSADCLVRVRDTQSFHIDKQDFCDIAYHFLVGQDGGVYEGVGWHVEGSHSYGYNDIALGIAFMGNFVEKPPNEAALQAAQDLIQCAVAKGYLTPDYLLMGHSDVSDILSPGQALYDIIKTWPHFKH